MRLRTALLAVAVSVCGAGLAVPAAAGPGQTVVQADDFTRDAPGLAAGQIELVTISARPSLVVGDAVRIAVRGLAAGDPLSLTVDGRPSAAVFTAVASRPGQAPGSREAVVRGLAPGGHRLTATSLGRTVTLVVTAHDANASTISGAQQEPFVCEQEAGLPVPGANCAFAPVEHWWYENVAGQFAQLADPTAAYPADTATTTVHGRTVPFVVRVDNFVVNRSTTQVAVLDDPHARRSAPFAAAEWNHQVVYHFGEACGTGFHQGTENESDVFGAVTSLSGSNIAGPLLGLPQRLAEGSMVIQSSLTIFGVHCNPVLSAETVNAILQRVWTDYGDIDRVIGGGGSGGAIQQLTLANDYPGLLDGITPTLEFPDVVTTLETVHDCLLMEDVFKADPLRWTLTKQLAVTGLQGATACSDWASEIGVDADPAHCPAGLPDAYDAATNPGGVRCDIEHDLKNVWGLDADGEPAIPVSNVGIEYGLKALQSGAITADDFVALNSQIGGLTRDDTHSAARTQMSDAEAARLFADGIVNDRGAINEVPIISQEVLGTQDAPDVDIHDEIRPFETRARLDQTYGGHGNQAVWIGAPIPSAAVVTMGEWLDRLDAAEAAHPGASRASLILTSRPADAADQCEVAGTAVTTACAAGVLTSTSPRQVAGGLLSEQDPKCRLQPWAPMAALSAAQNAQLAAVFATGICDYAKPSVGDTGARSPEWLSFGAGTTLASPVPVSYPIARSAAVASHRASTHSRRAGRATRRPAAASAGGATLAYTGLPAALPVLALCLVAAAAALQTRRGSGRPKK